MYMNRDDGLFHEVKLIAAIAIASCAGITAGCTGGGAEFDPESREIPPEYLAPPRPCALPETTLPIVALPWRGRAQTFLEAPTMPSAVQLDYDVWPRPHVDRVEFGFAFDAVADVTPVTIEEECPAQLDLDPMLSSLDSDSVVDGDVVRAIIVARDEERSRRGELFFATGSRRVAVSLPPDIVLEGPTFLMFEPAWGEPRVAMRVIEPDEEPPFELSGLPEGPGTVVWARPAAQPVRDLEAAAVYLPGGFAQDWPAFTTSWRAMPVTALPDEGSEPRVLSLGVDDFEDVVLRPGIDWDGERDLVLLTADAVGEALPHEAGSGEASPQGSVLVPCDTTLQLHSPSFAQVFASFAGSAPGEESELAFGSTLTLSATCDPGQEERELRIRARSRNERDIRIAIQAAAGEVMP